MTTIDEIRTAITSTRAGYDGVDDATLRRLWSALGEDDRQAALGQSQFPDRLPDRLMGVRIEKTHLTEENEDADENDYAETDE